LNDSSDAEDNIKDGSDKDEEIDKNNECDAEPDAKSGKSKLKKRNKKSVQFADGIKPGEGTSPSGGEGDMPSPPPPKGIGFRDGLGDLRRDKIYSSRKSRKQEKRARPPKAKKKVKVCDNYLLSHLEKMFKKRRLDSRDIFQLHYVRYVFFCFIGKDNQVEETTHYSIDSHDDG